MAIDPLCIIGQNYKTPCQSMLSVPIQTNWPRWAENRKPKHFCLQYFFHVYHISDIH